MSNYECDLSILLLKNYFGSIVSTVGGFLCINGWQPLAAIVQKTKLKQVLVRKSLSVLIQHKLVTFSRHKKRIGYRFILENAIQLIYIPKIIYTAKLLYGDPGELLVEEMLAHGMSMSETIVKRVQERLQESSEKVFSTSDIEKVFTDLVNARFVTKETIPEQNESQKNKEGDCEENKDADDVATGGMKRKMSQDDDAPESKRQRTDGDYYTINFVRFSQYFRDQLIVSGITHKFNQSSGEIVRTMLRISEVTTSAEADITQPISSSEIVHTLPKTMLLTTEYIEQYISIMINDKDKFLERSDESSNSMFVINIKNCLLALTSANILSYIQERFGSKCCRLFKLLMHKKHMEQKQVEDFAMIPSKEAKELLYSLLAENLLVMQEIPKTTDHAPSRTFYLFNVNLPKVVRTLRSRSYRIMINLITRQEFEIEENKRLLDKRERIDAIKANLQEIEEEQMEEIEEMLTSAEKGRLKALEHCCNKLGKSRIQISNTIFLLNQFIKCNI